LLRRPSNPIARLRAVGFRSFTPASNRANAPNASAFSPPATNRSVRMPTKLFLDHGTLDLDEGAFHPSSGEAVVLTPQELALCRWMAERPGEPFSRDVLMQTVLQYAPGVNSRAIDYTVFRLRAKIEANPAAPKVLQTAYGKGYKFVVPAQPTIEEHWLELVGAMPGVQAALSTSLQMLPEATVVEVLRRRGIIALGPAAHTIVLQAFHALEPEARALLVRLVPWRRLSSAVLQEQGAGLHHLGTLLKEGFLLRREEALFVPTCLRMTLLEAIDRADLAVAALAHARWVEQQLAVDWPITPNTLLYDSPIPDVDPGLFQECQEAMAHKVHLGPRTLRVLTAQRFSSSRAVIEVARQLQQQTKGTHRWDLRAREANRLEALGHTQEARSIWRALADEATQRGWAHRRVSATVHSLRGTSKLDARTMAGLTAVADRLGVHSASCLLRVLAAKQATKERVDTASADAIRYARQVGMVHFEVIALSSTLGGFRFGQREQTVPHLERAVALSRAASQPRLEAQARNNLALCLADLGQFERAAEVAREAIRLAEDVNEAARIIAGRTTLAAILHGQGELEEARRCCMEAASLASGAYYSFIHILQACVEADLGETVSAEASLARVSLDTYQPWVQLAHLHIALANQRPPDRVRAQLEHLPSDALFGTWLYLDYRLARSRLLLAIGRASAMQPAVHRVNLRVVASS